MKIVKQKLRTSPFTGAVTYSLFAERVAYANLLPYYLDLQTDGSCYARTSVSGLGAKGEDLWELCPLRHFPTIRQAMAHVKKCLQKYGTL